MCQSSYVIVMLENANTMQISLRGKKKCISLCGYSFRPVVPNLCVMSKIWVIGFFVWVMSQFIKIFISNIL